MRCVRRHEQHGDRDRFEGDVRPHLGELIELLVDGACAEIPRVSGFAAHLLARAESLWVFADREGVPPTNDIAERAIRKAVLWRKNCFGSQSDRGLRFTERMMTVIATKRRRAEGVLDYLVEVARAATRGMPAPELMPQPLHGRGWRPRERLLPPGAPARARPGHATSLCLSCALAHCHRVPQASQGT